MTKIALIILGVLAIFYCAALIVFSISLWPIGFLPLLGLIAMALFFAQAAREKLHNKEDKKYHNQVEP